MRQTKLGSFYESCINVAIGFGINFVANLVIFLFLGSILHLLTTFTLGYFIQSLVWLGVMWFAVGSIEEYMKQLRS